MFRCEYCQTEFIEHSPNCPNCGAQILLNATSGAADLAPIVQLCQALDDEEHFYFDDSIDEKRMKTVRERFNIPPDEDVWLVYDDTVFGSNREGFAVCKGGLYWRNDWTTESKRTFLRWSEFTRRKIEFEELRIRLGRGDNLGLALGNEKSIKDKLLKLFTALQKMGR